MLERDPMTGESPQRPEGRFDDAWISRFRSGDDEALAELYREHSALVYSYCRRGLGEGRAADVTQEVFLAAWRSRERFLPEKGSAAGWLMGIARFKIIDAYRRAERDPVDPLAGAPSEVGETSDELELMGLRMLVADALQTLPPRARGIVRRAFIDDWTHHRIAETYGIPLGTVKSDIRRGLRRLERHLEAFDAAQP